jgi:hypothetical protein
MASLRASLRAQTMRGAPDLAAIMRDINTVAYGGSAVSNFAAGAKRHDDMTLIVARILCS